ncbi:MAG: radical SAM protein [Clostridiales bacterium]|nr:radical SAM protein [Clostridiales bacterium]MDY3747700.1 radical SAM protein [Lachnospiraceae bacterium]
MKNYIVGKMELDSIDIKCMVVSKGVRVHPEVYEQFSDIYNISQDMNRLSCIILPDGTVMTMSDMEPFLEHMGGRYFWSKEEKEYYYPQLETPFHIRVIDGKPALTFHETLIDFVTFPKKNQFYDQVTSTGKPFYPSSVLQGTDWLTFGYLWPCEFAAAGFPCQYCHCGHDTMARVKNKVPFDDRLTGKEMGEIINYGVKKAGLKNIQITGGSTISGEKEAKYFTGYIDAVNEYVGRENIPGDIVYYITPPKDTAIVDYYIENGVNKIGCSVEVWDETMAKVVTPGKMKYTTRQRHLDILHHIVDKYGKNIAFSNFVVGIEPFESLKEGATYMAEHGITPVVSILQIMGLSVLGKTTPPDLDYYKRVKDLFLNLYDKYQLVPAEQSGENGCLEVEFYNAVRDK